MPETLPPPGDQVARLLRRMDEQDRKIATLETALRAAYTTIGQGGLTVNKGGNVNLEDGGSVAVRDGGGIDIYDGGRFNAKHPGEGADDAFSAGLVRNLDGSTAGYGTIVQQADGTDIFQARSDVDTGGSVVRASDRHGTLMVATDPAVGGLSRPLIPFVFTPYWSTAWESTTNAAFEPVLQSYARRGSPQGRLRVNGYAPAGTTGEVRVRVDGVQVGATLAVPGGGTVGTTITFDMPAPLDWSTVEVLVDARMTSGTGPVNANVTWGTTWVS